MDPLGFEPRAFRMRSGCDTTTPYAPDHVFSRVVFVREAATLLLLVRVGGLGQADEPHMHGLTGACATIPAPIQVMFPRIAANKKIKKADSTLRTSQAVPHPSTIRALSCLTSEVKRDPVYSTRYGRQRNICDFFSLCANIQNGVPDPPLGRVLRHFFVVF